MDRKPFQHRDKAFLLLDGLIVGAVSGGFVVLFRYLLGVMEEWRHVLYQETSVKGLVFLILIAVFSAIIVQKLLDWAPLSGGSGIPQIQGEILGIFRMDGLPVAVSKMIGGSLATLTGLALGREGPSIQIGASVAKILSKGMHRDKTKEKMLITAGAAAGLSAAFSAPLAGVLFTVEEIHKNTSKAMIAVTLTASIVANYIAAYVFKLTPVFSFTITELLPLPFYGHIIGLSAVTAVVGVLFCKGIVLGQEFYKKLPIPKGYKMIFIFLTAVLIGKFVPDILGGGHHVIETLEENPAAVQYIVLLLAGRFLFTCFSFGSGVQGGIFLPILVLGGIIGILYHRFIVMMGLIPDYYLANMIVLAMAAILTAVVRAPILSIVLVLEMNGNLNQVLGLCMASSVAYFVAEFLKEKPIYETLLQRSIEKTPKGEKETYESTIFETIIPHGSKMENIRIKDIGLPENCLLIEVKRGGKVYIPKGKMVLQGGDEIAILTTDFDIFTLREALRDYLSVDEY
ncbi:MAG: ClC family H(+)/Cl(-) exchange transporter [Gallicola sp.]|nr:ClC family H(+)/Cl(-) exchange transporter [Gallicola sp.]